MQFTSPSWGWVTLQFLFLKPSCNSGLIQYKRISKVFNQKLFSWGSNKLNEWLVTFLSRITSSNKIPLSDNDHGFQESLQLHDSPLPPSHLLSSCCSLIGQSLVMWSQYWLLIGQLPGSQRQFSEHGSDIDFGWHLKHVFPFTSN